MNTAVFESHTFSVADFIGRMEGVRLVTPAFQKLRVVGILMQDCSINGTVILFPLILNVNQRPSTPAELKMLQAGQLQKVLFPIFHQ